MDKLQIELTIEQTQRVLNYIGKAPYMEIADIIETIKQQASEQMNPKFAEPKEGETRSV